MSRAPICAPDGPRGGTDTSSADGRTAQSEAPENRQLSHSNPTEARRRHVWLTVASSAQTLPGAPRMARASRCVIQWGQSTALVAP